MLEESLALLKRQYELLAAQAEDDEFLYQLPHFVGFLREHPVFSLLTEECTHEVLQELAWFEEQEALLRARLEGLIVAFAEACPIEDDRDCAPCDRGHADWVVFEHSLSRLLSRLKADRRIEFPHRRTDDDPHSPLHELGMMLQARFSESKAEVPGALHMELGKTRDAVNELALQWRIFVRADGTLALARLTIVVMYSIRIGGAAAHATSLGEYRNLRMREWTISSKALRRQLPGALADDLLDSRIPEDVIALRADAKRAYEEIWRRIGLARSRRTLVDRFIQQCHWYDAESLRTQAVAQPKNAEHLLTAQFAKFLFQAGLNPITKPMIGRLEPDVFDGSSTSTFYVEAKQYKNAQKARATVRDGAAQVWDTLIEMRGTPYEVREAFLLVFRVGGPRYVFPDPIRSEGVTLIPLLVDIAPVQSKGSRAKKPIVLPEEVFLPEKAT